MNNIQRVLSTAKKLGILRPRDVDVPRTLFADLTQQGLLERIGRGLYRLPESEPSEHHSFVEVAVRVPRAVISLLSALQFHEIGTQNPHQVWITIDVKARSPRLEYPPLRVMRASGKSLMTGIEVHKIEGHRVSIYSAEKTIVDCFKYRNKIGLDIGLEALKEAVKKKRIKIDTLWKYAEICRITNVIKPYIEAL